jgi:hypothetical protein
MAIWLKKVCENCGFHVPHRIIIQPSWFYYARDYVKCTSCGIEYLYSLGKGKVL